MHSRTYTYRDISGTNKTTAQVSRYQYKNTAGTAITFDYTYDALGNIASYTDASGVQVYEYDAQNQLKKVKTNSGSVLYAYTYDDAGNILTANGNTYTYGNAVWKDLLTAFNGQTITYDGSGNPLSYYNGTRWEFEWEEGRNLVKATVGSTKYEYAYDLNGLRTSKKVDNVTHNYYYASGKLLRETYGSNILDFFYDQNGYPYALKYNGTLYYYITNLQGDVLHLTNASGTAVVSYTYDPYGKPLTTTGTLASTVGAANPLRYRGYYYDTETGFCYLQSRYYDPTICRFINADSYTSTGQGIIGCNMFVYCGNNPASRVDSYGYFHNQVCYTYFDGAGGTGDNTSLIRDVTSEVMAALQTAVDRGRGLRYLNDHVYYGDTKKLIALYLDFASLVGNDASWDIKHEGPWESTIGTQYPGESTEVYFCGILMTPDILGNVTYGYLGHAYGIPLNLLYVGSYYVAGSPTSGQALANERADWSDIRTGYLLASSGILEKEGMTIL